MFFDDVELAPRKSAVLRALPPTPETGWRPPTEFPNLSSAVALSYDLETFDPNLVDLGPGWARGDGHIVGVALGAIDRLGNRGQWYFPIRHEVEPEYNLDPTSVLRFTKHWVETPLPKVGANLLYDVGWSTTEGIYVEGDLHDIQFAEALLDEDAFVNLEVLSHKYIGYGKSTDAMYRWQAEAYGGAVNSKQRANIYRTSPRLVGYYGEGDAANPLAIIERQISLLNGEELYDLYRLECDLIPLLVRMRLEGVQVDIKQTETLYGELAHDIGNLYKKLEATYGLRLEKSSSGEISRLLTHLGIKFPRNAPTKTQPLGTPSIEKEWLKNLEHPVGELLNEIREHEKIRSTFIRSYILEGHTNGKLHPQFHPLKGDENGTKLGRFASSDPNLQNIPSRTDLGKRVRCLFTPDTGHSNWRKHDYSQIHYRLLADIAIGPGADQLREEYNSNPKTDYHMNVYMKAAPMLGWSTTDPEIIKVKRRPIKNVNFGLLYGQSAPSLSYKAGFSPEEGKEFFEIYHKAAPYVKPTMGHIGQEVQKYGYVRTLLGRRVRFNLWEPIDRDYNRPAMPLPYHEALNAYGSRIRRAFEYRGVNYKLQGSEPDVMKTGMRKLHKSGVFDYVGVPRLTVHDELDWSQRDQSPEMIEAFKFVQHTMETAIKIRVPINVDATTGPNWGKAD